MAAELRRRLDLTPYSRTEYLRAFQKAPDDPVEKARLMLVKSYMSINTSPVGTDGSSFDMRDIHKRPRKSKEFRAVAETFAPTAARLRNVVLENSDFPKIIKLCDSAHTLFYCDPPYVMSTRNDASRGYVKHEMTDERHAELAGLLRGIKGMAIVSGYRSDLYDELYRGWERHDRDAVTNFGKRRVESLWISPNASTTPRLF